MNDDLANALARAWPKGIPAQEDAIAQSLSADKSRLVAARLRGLLVVEDGGTVTQGYQAAAMDRTYFHDLRRKWEATRSIVDLTPHIRRPLPRPPRKPDIAKAIELDAAELIGRLDTENVAFSQNPMHDIVRNLARRHGASMKMARRYVDEAIRKARPHGRAIGIVRIGATLEDGAPLYLAITIDNGTARIVNHHLDGSSGSLIKAREMLIAHDAQEGTIRAHHSLGVETTGAGQQVGRLSGRPGVAVSRIIGNNIDTLQLRPNDTANPDHDLRFADIEQARSYVAYAVGEHNARLDTTT